MQTKILNLMEAEGEGVAVLKTITALKRTGGESAGVQLDVILNFPVRTSLECEELDKLIPGASSMYADRDKLDEEDPARAEHKALRKFADDSRHLTLTIAEDGQEGGGRVILSDQGCSVIQGQFRTLKRAAAFEVKIRVYGVVPSDVGHVVEGLSEHVGVMLKRDQGELFGSGPTEGADNVESLDAHRERLRPKIGQLVVGRYEDDGEAFAGIVVELNEEGGSRFLLIRDFERESLEECVAFEVPEAQVTSALNVAPPRGRTLEQCVATYHKAAVAEGTTPTALAIVQALGQEHAGKMAPQESWALTADLLRKAGKIEIYPEPTDGTAADADEEFVIVAQ